MISTDTPFSIACKSKMFAYLDAFMLILFDLSMAIGDSQFSFLGFALGSANTFTPGKSAEASGL